MERNGEVADFEIARIVGDFHSAFVRSGDPAFFAEADHFAAGCQYRPAAHAGNQVCGVFEFERIKRDNRSRLGAHDADDFCIAEEI